MLLINSYCSLTLSALTLNAPYLLLCSYGSVNFYHHQFLPLLNSFRFFPPASCHSHILATFS